MANRDQSQGFSFVYLDIKELLSSKHGWSEDGPVPTFGAQTVAFNRDGFAAEKKAEAPPKTDKTPVSQIKENLDRLQSLHHRIHVMLEELSQLGTKRKKDPKDEE